MSRDFDHQILQRHAFGLVDASGVEELPEGIPIEALVPPLLAASAHLMPRLIALHGLRDDQKNALLECLYRTHVENRPPPVSLLIDSDLSQKEFARHWNSMQLAAPESERRAWLRLHDPRVLHQLLRILNATQRRKLYGRSAAFTYWAAGEWLTEAAGDDSGEAAGSVQWDWARVECIGTINRALHSAQVRGGTALTRQGALAEQLIERAASRYGLTSQADMVEFAARGLSTHFTFDEHPAVAGRIKPDQDDDSTLADRFALIDGSVWNELRQPSITK